MSILEDIDKAAYDLKNYRIIGFMPVAPNFNIVERTAEYGRDAYVVYSYETPVILVKRCDDDKYWQTFVYKDAFHYSATTSKHVRRFLSALIGYINWDMLYKACNRECDREAISGNGAQFINVTEVA